MRNLLNFLAKYNNLIIFLILEGIAFYLLGTRNNYHNTTIIKSIRGITTGIETRLSNARSYFHLREISQVLAAENASMKNSIERLGGKGISIFQTVNDSSHSQKYIYSAARIVNSSVNRQKNFFTIDRGRKQGLAVDMAVTSGGSVAGITMGCSNNYSVVMSVLNLDFRLSARIKSNGYFGSLSWDGSDINHAVLSEIPQHVIFGIGDTIETTGYSAIFPEGLLIGTVSSFERSGSDFYRIKVKLATDFRKLRYVTVIGNLEKMEQNDLEKLFQ
jgi:rod shape-determining protein MreC